MPCGILNGILEPKVDISGKTENSNKVRSFGNGITLMLILSFDERIMFL